MTKYEYYHNKEHKRKFISRGGPVYSTPVERVIIIILINLIIIGMPILVIFNLWDWCLTALIMMIAMLIWTEYNIFYNLERIEYLVYFLFAKNNGYKELIVYLNQYENQVEFENKLGRKIKKSYINCCKIYFVGKNSGYFTSKILCFNGIKETVDFKNLKTKKEILDYIKEKKKNH